MRYLHGRSSDEPVIAEPTSFKHEVLTKPEFSIQWEFFAEALATAAEIYVLGYSLPDGDILAKQAFVTSIATNPDANWTLVNPCLLARNQYRRLLGDSRCSFPGSGRVEEWVLNVGH